MTISASIALTARIARIQPSAASSSVTVTLTVTTSDRAVTVVTTLCTGGRLKLTEIGEQGVLQLLVTEVDHRGELTRRDPGIRRF